jgi:hypothetical protein
MTLAACPPCTALVLLATLPGPPDVGRAASGAALAVAADVVKDVKER